MGELTDHCSGTSRRNSWANKPRGFMDIQGIPSATLSTLTWRFLFSLLQRQLPKNTPLLDFFGWCSKISCKWLVLYIYIHTYILYIYICWKSLGTACVSLRGSSASQEAPKKPSRNKTCKRHEILLMTMGVKYCVEDNHGNKTLKKHGVLVASVNDTEPTCQVSILMENQRKKERTSGSK